MHQEIQWNLEGKPAAYRLRSGSKYNGNTWKQRPIVGRGVDLDQLKMMRLLVIKLKNLQKVVQFSVIVLPHANVIAVINDVI